MYKKQFQRVAAGLLCMSLVCVGMPSYQAQARVSSEEAGHEIAVTQLPGTVVTEKSYDDSFLSVTGYVENGVNDRSAYYEEYVEYNRLLKEKFVAEGGKPEDYVNQNTEDYYVVSNEEEFCDAVASWPKVIELTTDLNLGYKYMEAQNMKTYGVVNAISDYKKNNVPISSPDLIRDGVSEIKLKDRDGLTIFSRNGSTIYHCEIGIVDSNDVVIRNIGIQGLNEWDDFEYNSNGATPGGHKRYDWDNISIYQSTNIWIDHCTLGIAYDGSVDITDASTATLSWCRIGEPDERMLQEMQNTMDYMEELYQQGKGHKFYTALRDGGATKDQIMKFSLLNDKVHAFSCSEGYYDKNIYDRITMAYNYYKNSVQRVPQIRSGNAHMFNCWINSDDYISICNEISAARSYASKQGCSTLGLCRANSALGGSTIGTDTCIFEGVINPIISSEYQGNGENDLGIQEGAPNHNLIVNSSTRRYGQTEAYIGSSWDNDGENAFVGGDYWKDKKTINNFIWAKWKDITKDASKASDTVYYLPEAEALKLAPGAFYQRYFIGSENLDYDYQTVPLNEVKTTLNTYGGCGKVELDAEDWLRVKQTTDKDVINVIFDYQTEGVTNAAVYGVTAGTSVKLPGAVEKEGYSFGGWFTKEYALDEAGELTYTEVPFTAQTPVTGDTYVFAKWNVNRYQLRLELNGGTTTLDTTYTCDYNSLFNLTKLSADAFSKDGNVLEGWYLDEACTKSVQFVRVTGDTVVYAKWKEAPASSEPAQSQKPVESSIPDVSEQPEPSTGALPPQQSETPLPEQSAAPLPEESASPLPQQSAEPSEAPKPSGIMGDVNGNGSVDLGDAQLVLKAALKIEKLDADQIRLADCNMDQVIDLSDAQIILKKALKIIP